MHATFKQKIFEFFIEMDSHSSMEENDNFGCLNDSLLRYLDLSQVSDDHNCSHSLWAGEDNYIGQRPTDIEEEKELSGESKPSLKIKTNSTFFLNCEDHQLNHSRPRFEDFEDAPLRANCNLYLSEYYSNSTNYTTTNRARTALKTPTNSQSGIYRMTNLNPQSNPTQVIIYPQQFQDFKATISTPRNLNNNLNNMNNFGMKRYVNNQFSNTSTPIVNSNFQFQNESQSKVKFHFQSNFDGLKTKEANKKSSLKPSVNQVNYDFFSTEEIVKCIPFMIKEQSGCRFLQQKVAQTKGYSDDLIIPVVESNLFSIMIDQFGNYLIQKILEHCESNPKSFKRIQDIVSV